MANLNNQGVGKTRERREPFPTRFQQDGLPLPRNSTEMQSYNAEARDMHAPFSRKNTLL